MHTKIVLALFLGLFLIGENEARAGLFRRRGCGGRLFCGRVFPQSRLCRGGTCGRAMPTRQSCSGGACGPRFQPPGCAGGNCGPSLSVSSLSQQSCGPRGCGAVPVEPSGCEGGVCGSGNSSLSSEPTCEGGVCRPPGQAAGFDETQWDSSHWNLPAWDETHAPQRRAGIRFAPTGHSSEPSSPGSARPRASPVEGEILSIPDGAIGYRVRNGQIEWIKRSDSQPQQSPTNNAEQNVANAFKPNESQAPQGSTQQTRETASASEAVPTPTKPKRLLILSANFCGWCNKLADSLKSQGLGEYKIVIYKTDARKFDDNFLTTKDDPSLPQLTRNILEQDFAKRKELYPTLYYVDENDQYRYLGTGYVEPGKLLERLNSTAGTR